MQTQWNVIIEILKKIADKDFQKAVWAEHKNKHPLFSFGETINTLGDYFFFDSIKNRELALSEVEYEILDQYIENLLDYNEPNNTFLMAEDIKWLNIVKTTNQVVDILEKNAPTNSNDLKSYYSFKNE